MADETPETQPPARRRLRKRWIFVGILLTFLFFALRSLRERPLAELTLADGRTFTVHKLTYGKQHSFSPRTNNLTAPEVWLNKWLRRIGREIQLSFQSGLIGTMENSLCLWHTFDWTTGAKESTPQSLVLTESHGWRSVINLSYLAQSAQSPPMPGQQASFLSCPLFSQTSKLQLDLYNAVGHKLAAGSISYDLPNELQQAWIAQSLPVTEKNGNFSVTVKSLNAKWPKVVGESKLIGDMLEINVDYEVMIDGSPSTSWSWLSGVPYLEMSTAGALVESNAGCSSTLKQCTVSPYDPLWKLRLPLVCQNPEEVAPGDRTELGKTKFITSQVTPPSAPELVSLGQAKIQLLGAGKAGSFTYEGAGEAPYPIPMPFPVEGATRNQLQGTFQLQSNPPGQTSFSFVAPVPVLGQRVRQFQHPMTVTTTFTALRPHVAISVDKSEDRYSLVLVKNEQGQILKGELFNLQGLLIWLADESYDNVEEVDVTLLLQKPKEFSFIVAPPQVPPRPAEWSK